MVNNKLKLVKSATAFVIGATVLTGAFAAAGSDTAFAKNSTSVKVSNGKLVNKSTGKVVKGYKTYNKALYKDGKKFTGLYKKTYYKAGKKATGTYKSVYYKAGKAYTGVTNKTYYKAGKKATGTYKNVYYKTGKAYTGVVNKTYYKAGKKATGLYKGVYYKTGKAATGIYNDKLYISGNLSKGLELYKEQLYKDGSLNKGLVVFKDQLYKDAVLNKGLVEFDKKFYFDAALANDTYTDQGVERAFENGVEVGAKVKAVEAINATEIKVTFNKTVDKSTAEDFSNNYAITKANSAAVSTVTINGAKLQSDKKTVILTSSTPLNSDTKAEYTVNVKNVKTAVAGDKFAEFSKVVSLYDNTPLAVEGITLADSNTIKVVFSEPVNTTAAGAAGAIQFKLSGVTVSVPSSAYKLSDDKKSVSIDVAASGLEAGKTYTVSVDGLTDFASNALPRYETSFTVVKDEVKPELQSVESLSLGAFKVVFSEPVKNSSILVNIDGTSASASIVKDTTDETGKTYIATLDSAVLAGNHLVTIHSYTDIAGNAGASVVKEVKFAASKPALTSTVEVKTIAGVKYQVYTYDRAVKLASGVTSLSASYVDSNNVTHSGTVTAKDSSTVDALSKNQIAIPLSTLTTGKYTVTLAAGNVKDAFGQSADAATFKFDTTADAAQTTVSSVLPNGVTSGTTTGSLNKVTVKFASTVGDDALEVSHYTVDGVQVFESAIFDGDKKTVTLTVKPGAITSTNEKTVKVTGIKNVEDKTLPNIKFVENVKPAVVKNELLAYNKVQLTFTKVISTTPVASDFKVTVDNKELATTAYTVSNSNDKVIITLNTQLTSSSVPVNVAVVTDNLKDASGNSVEQKDLGTSTVNLSDTALAYTNAITALNTAVSKDLTVSSNLVAAKNALTAAKDAKVAAGSPTTSDTALTDAQTAITNAETAIADTNAVTDAKAALATPTISTDALNLGTLPTTVGTTEVSIAWSSSDNTKVTDAGVYASGAAAGEDVTLTATITKGSAKATTVTYKVTVNDTKITTITKN